MSVVGTLTLPDQPAAGSVAIRPLGGNGYSSPQSYYLAELVVTADASGGTLSATISMDPQYQSVVSLMHASLDSGAADRITRLDIFPESLDPVFSVIANMVVDSDVGQDLLYAPPPLFPVGRVAAFLDNVDTEVLHLGLVIYNFKRDAFQKVPLNVLLDSLPRGFAVQ